MYPKSKQSLQNFVSKIMTNLDNILGSDEAGSQNLSPSVKPSETVDESS
jgi:hypothetical protein